MGRSQGGGAGTSFDMHTDRYQAKAGQSIQATVAQIRSDSVAVFSRSAQCLMSIRSNYLKTQTWTRTSKSSPPKQNSLVLSDRLPYALRYRLQELFQHISPTPQSIFLGISAEDSSIVYYKISDGVVAPKEVKD
jgi:hypothetical protein